MKMVGPNLTNDQRRKMVWYLQENAKKENNNELKRGTILVLLNCLIVPVILYIFKKNY